MDDQGEIVCTFSTSRSHVGMGHVHLSHAAMRPRERLALRVAVAFQGVALVDLLLRMLKLKAVGGVHAGMLQHIRMLVPSTALLVLRSAAISGCFAFATATVTRYEKTILAGRYEIVLPDHRVHARQAQTLSTPTVSTPTVSTPNVGPLKNYSRTYDPNK